MKQNTSNPEKPRKTGIWIDSSKAVLVTLQEDGPDIEEITAEIENRVYHENEGDKGSFAGTMNGEGGAMVGFRRLDNNKKFDERRQHQVSRFLDTVVERIRSANEIAILGPAQMKKKLHTRVLADHNFNPRITALEAAGKLTRNQLVKRVKEIFGVEKTTPSRTNVQ